VGALTPPVGPTAIHPGLPTVNTIRTLPSWPVVVSTGSLRFSVWPRVSCWLGSGCLNVTGAGLLPVNVTVPTVDVWKFTGPWLDDGCVL
jgi:hypothetical protein